MPPGSGGHCRDVNPVFVPSLREGLLSFVGKSHKGRRKNSAKRKLLRIANLNVCNTPNLVLETLSKDQDGGLISTFTARDGRKLWSGQTKMSKYSSGDDFPKRKFTSPRAGFSAVVRQRIDRLSYLFSAIAESGLTHKAIHPLERMIIQCFKLKDRDFKGLFRKIMSSLSCAVSRQPLGFLYFPIKPHICEEKKQLNSAYTAFCCKPDCSGLVSRKGPRTG